MTDTVTLSKAALKEQADKRLGEAIRPLIDQEILDADHGECPWCETVFDYQQYSWRHADNCLLMALRAEYERWREAYDQ